MSSETLTWIAANGTELALDGTAGVRIEEGGDGRFMPPFEMFEQAAPDGGGWVTAAVPQMRTITLPLAFDTATPGLTRLLLRVVQALFDPTLGPGRLRAATPGGDTRDIYAWYAGGLEGDEALTDPGLTEYRAAVKFRCDMAWLDASDTSISWRVDEAPGGFFPFLPLRLASSEIFASAPVTTNGSFDTQPLWTVTGPASSVTCRNLTTGRVWSWGGTLTAGEVLVVDTRRRPDTNTPKAVLVNGDNAFGDLDGADHDLWPLVPGSNLVQVELTGATAATEVAMRWRNRWLGA